MMMIVVIMAMMTVTVMTYICLESRLKVYSVSNISTSKELILNLQCALNPSSKNYC
jgi:hypothetical protein